MIKMTTLKNNKEMGFTLIEILVVILIIGILAAIAIPMFLNQRKAAVDASVKSDVSNAIKQIETWLINNGEAQQIPSLEVTGSGTTGENLEAPLADIKVSSGTTLTIIPDPNVERHYFIYGLNDGGDKSAGGIIYASEYAQFSNQEFPE